MTKELCHLCDAGCCKVFFLPKDHKIKFSTHTLYSNLMDLYSKIFCFLFTRNVDKGVKKYIEDTNQSRNRIALSCILLRKNRCIIYPLRPFFCKRYRCYGNDQVYHAYLKKNGLPLPKSIGAYKKLKEEGKHELKSDCIKNS